MRPDHHTCFPHTCSFQLRFTPPLLETAAQHLTRTSTESPRRDYYTALCTAPHSLARFLFYSAASPPIFFCTLCKCSPLFGGFVVVPQKFFAVETVVMEKFFPKLAAFA